MKIRPEVILVELQTTARSPNNNCQLESNEDGTDNEMVECRTRGLKT